MTQLAGMVPSDFLDARLRIRIQELFSGPARRRTRTRHRAGKLATEPLEARRLLVVYTVDTTDDLDSASSGSLRWAIDQANANPGVDQIDFSLPAGSKTIVLDPARGELATITDSVTFDCNDGGTKVAIDGTSIAGHLRRTGLRFDSSSTSPHAISDVVLIGFDTGLVIAGTSGASSNLNTLTNVDVTGSVEVGIHIQNDFVQVTSSTVVSGLTGVLADGTAAGFDNVTVDGTDE